MGQITLFDGHSQVVTGGVHLAACALKSCVRERMDRNKFVTDAGFSRFQVEICLQIQPILRRLLKGAPEQQGKFRRYRPRALDDMRYPHRRYADLACKSRLRHPQLIQRLGQILARVDWGQTVVDHDGCSSVVIDNLNVEGMCALEPETNPPLAIDANAPLPSTITSEFFQLIGRWQAQILNPVCGVNLAQTHCSPFQNFGRQTTGLPSGEEAFCFGVSERLNHRPKCKHYVYDWQANVTRGGLNAHQA